MLMGKTHHNEEELLHYIREFAEVNAEQAERCKKTLNTSLKYDRDSKEGEINHNTTTFEKKFEEIMQKPTLSGQAVRMSKTFQKNKGDVKCYNCQLYGHICRNSSSQCK